MPRNEVGAAVEVAQTEPIDKIIRVAVIERYTARVLSGRSCQDRFVVVSRFVVEGGSSAPGKIKFSAAICKRKAQTRLLPKCGGLVKHVKRETCVKRQSNRPSTTIPSCCLSVVYRQRIRTAILQCTIELMSNNDMTTTSISSCSFILQRGARPDELKLARTECALIQCSSFVSGPSWKDHGRDKDRAAVAAAWKDSH